VLIKEASYFRWAYVFSTLQETSCKNRDSVGMGLYQI